VRSPVLPSSVTTSAQCFQKGYLVHTHRTWSLFLILSMCPLTVHLDLIAVSLSPTSPSPTQAPSTALRLSMAKLITHRHVRIAFFRFPFCQHDSHSIALLITIFLDDALNPPLPPPPPCPRRHVFVAGIAVSTPGHHFSSVSKHHPRSIIIFPRQTARPSYSPSTPRTCTTSSTRNATATPTHQHHYERCYDYDPIMCRSTVVVALFEYVIVSHNDSTVTSNRHPTLTGYSSVASVELSVTHHTPCFGVLCCVPVLYI